MLIVVVAVFRTKYVFALSCGLVLPLLGTSMLQFSMEQDDIAHFYKLERTYPLTIRQIVLAKYILALLCIGFFLLVSFGLSFLYVYGYRVTTSGRVCKSGCRNPGGAYLPLHYIPGLLSLWRQKGHHSVCGGNGCFSLVYVTSYYGFGVLELLTIDRTLLLVISYPVSIILALGSYLLSVRCYGRRIK